MLYEYGVKNFFSFRDGASISFRLPNTSAENTTESKRYSTIMCVKGANGSGKTHLLKGLAFLSHFISKSFAADPEDDLQIESFAGSLEPCSFYAKFEINGVVYDYQLETTSKRIVSESLYRIKSRRAVVFSRSLDEVTKRSSDLKQLDGIKLRRNASVISTAAQHEISGLEPVHKYFSHCAYNVTAAGLGVQNLIDMRSACAFLFKSPEALKFVTEFIKDCDVGIEAIKILEESSDGESRYFPVFEHLIDGELVGIRERGESSGTKHLLRHLIAYAMVLASGSYLVLDEFDLYLHPAILKKLLWLFTDEGTNNSGAQLIFTTHQTNVMDICGRYRTCLVNKDNNSSFVYRLDEIPGDILRNDRPISPVYMEGKIGGVPRI